MLASRLVRSAVASQPFRTVPRFSTAAQILGRKPRKTVINKVLAGYQPSAVEFKPQKVNGKWNKPKRSARMRAKIKKTMLVNDLKGWDHGFEPTKVRVQRSSVCDMFRSAALLTVAVVDFRPKRLCEPRRVTNTPSNSKVAWTRSRRTWKRCQTESPSTAKKFVMLAHRPDFAGGYRRNEHSISSPVIKLLVILRKWARVSLRSQMTEGNLAAWHQSLGQWRRKSQ